MICNLLCTQAGRSLPASYGSGSNSVSWKGISGQGEIQPGQAFWHGFVWANGRVRIFEP